MTDQPILLDVDGAIARLTLNRPEKRNAFDDGLIGALDDGLAAIEADDRIRAVILTGAGDHFSAGADLGWMRQAGAQGPEENRASAHAFAEAVARLDQLPVPTVAVVRGATYGGGVGLVCACDIALCDLSARFCLSEVRLGLAPAVIGPYVVRALGQSWARRLMLTAEVVPADMARAVGLVQEIAADPDARAAELAGLLLAGAPGAQAEAKALVRRAAGPVDDALRGFTADLIARLRAAPEGREGLDAFFAKRPPSWAGRDS
ncbi:MAG: enoyl-CoA hydratase-related protein [Alphaproteobacteria bacterium]